jgi:hypothetical protein
MTRPDFVRRLEAALARRGLAFKHAELLAWVEATWARVQRDPEAERWAAAFLEVRAALVKERPTTSEQEHSSRAGTEDKEHDHLLRLIIKVVAVVIFILLWKTDLLSRILRALGS